MEFNNIYLGHADDTLISVTFGWVPDPIKTDNESNFTYLEMRGVF